MPAIFNSVSPTKLMIINSSVWLFPSALRFQCTSLLWPMTIHLDWMKVLFQTGHYYVWKGKGMSANVARTLSGTWSSNFLKIYPNEPCEMSAFLPGERKMSRPHFFHGVHVWKQLTVCVTHKGHLTLCYFKNTDYVQFQFLCVLVSFSPPFFIGARELRGEIYCKVPASTSRALLHCVLGCLCVWSCAHSWNTRPDIWHTG